MGMKYFFLLLISVTAAAAQPKTLDECMSYAVEHAPAANIQALRNEQAAADYKAAIAALLPSLSASSSAGLNFGRGVGDNNTYVDTRAMSTSFGLSSGLTIFDGGRAVNNLRMRQTDRALGADRLAQVRHEVATAVMEAFFNVLYYQKMEVLAAAQLEESSQNLLQTERMEQLGVKGRPDVVEMRAQAAAAAYRLTEQRNRLAVGTIILKERMNFPLADSLALAPFEIDVEPAACPSKASEIYAAALASLPQVQIAAGQLRMQRIALQMARGARLPSLSLGAGLSTGFWRDLDDSRYVPFKEQLANKRGWSFGASLNIPLFNGWAATTAVRRGRSGLAIAQIEHDDALRGLRVEIEQAVADMNGAAVAAAAAMQARQAAAAAHELTQRRYDEGLSSALELHTSANRLLDTRAAELQARLGWILKKRIVDYYNK